MNAKFLKYISKSAPVLLAVLFFASCSNLDESALKVDTDNKVVYSETFATSVGKFTEVSVTGNQKWEYSATYGCMVITGFVDTNGDGVKENIENEDWLISPEVDLSGLSAAKLTFDHAGNYFATVSNSTTLWISEDYKDGLPSTGTWTQLTITKDVTNKDFTFVTPEISLTSYVGKKVRIALKYNSTATKAGTWEVKNFAVKSGEAVVEPVVDNGKGTEASPYNVKGAIGNQGVSAWVRGYVVGYVWSGTNTSYVFGADTCTQATNILIGDTIGNLYLSRCVAVQLPTGAIRNAFNLPVNKSLIGQKVTLYGSLESYFGSGGLKNVTYGIRPDGTDVGLKPIDYESATFYESFAASIGAFTQYSVAGDQIWGYSSTYKCMIMNGYANSKRWVNDDWLISPAINLTSISKDKLVVNFTMAGKYFYGSITNNCSLYVSTDYVSGNVSSATWTKLTIPKYDTSDNFTWTQTGDIDISAYKGKSNVRFAIQYLSDGTTNGTGQLEIKNFVVY